ncbi:hypothetical protein [Treponema denticola]|uniref:Uncharacterized protein n=2 Tax=Treponema denticola TaxID=158 RepID=A0A0F6MNZ7_TREDN|nr:hypothetical protein [Treponema denticola]EMB20900.1 hypothetical protein HMPREF9723_01531 [Treponema denticola OTK]
MKYIESEEIIKLDFQKESESPDIIFHSLQTMFNSIITLQNELLSKVDPLLDIQFILSDLKYSSIISKYIKKILIPDEEDNITTIPTVEGNIMQYLNASQDSVINTVSNFDGLLIKNDTLNEIVENISKISVETGVSKNVNFRMPNKIIIAKSLEQLEDSTNILDLKDKYHFIRKNEEKTIRKVYLNIDYDQLKNEMTEKIIETPIHIKLKIKIADFLGHSRWKFKLENGKTIDAKILDEVWLNKFHEKKEILGPGDSIEIKGTVKDYYDETGNMIYSDYIINNVIRIHEANDQREINF